MVPRPLIRFGHAVVVATYLVAFLFRQPLFIWLLWPVLAVGLLNPKWNLLLILGRVLLKGRLPEAPMEDAGANRFSLMLGVLFITASGLGHLLGYATVGWAAAGMHAFAAALALSGFCLGCALYLRIRYVRHRLGL